MVLFAEDALPGHAQLQLHPTLGPLAWHAPSAAPARDSQPARLAGGFGSYSARKPYVVPERLEELCGPIAGTVTLPPHLDWSGNSTYDLGKPARLASMYRSVLNEAGSAEDLRAWLNARLLAQLWPTLWLPAALRRLWEERFPQLGALRAQTV